MTANNNYMIIDFNVNFNNYDEKILNYTGFFTYVCPSCGAIHSLTRHAVYERNISFLQKNILFNKKLKILRLKCSSCEKTHAILPNDVIPYCIYSYSFMIKILTVHFLEKESVLSIADNYNISYQLIYSFISKLKQFFNDCIYVLRLLSLLTDIFNPSTYDVLNTIHNLSLKSCFLQIFFNTTKWMFLMKKFLNIRPNPIVIESCDTQF